MLKVKISIVATVDVNGKSDLKKLTIGQLLQVKPELRNIQFHRIVNRTVPVAEDYEV